MSRYFLEISYDGTNYHGWQIQTNAISVQEKIQLSLSTLLKEQIEVVGCGRTDTGVHAKQYFLHFDTEKFNGENDAFLYRLNAILPKDIVVHNIFKVNDNYHARFDAIYRTYRYFVHQIPTPFLGHYSLYYYPNLDFDKMNKATELLLKFEDFTSFSKLHSDVNNNNCKIKEAKWFKKDEQWVFEISANRFLRNMVRAIVGTLLSVGEDKISIHQFEEIVLMKDRGKAGKSVNGKALFLWEIGYDIFDES